MTQVTSAQANKLMQVALFTEAQRSESLINMLTDEAPKTAKIVGGGKQTSHTAPVVRVTDLTKNAGDEVDMQIVHQLSGRPTMGDKPVAGRLESLSFADFSLKINQARHGVAAGGAVCWRGRGGNLVGGGQRTDRGAGQPDHADAGQRGRRARGAGPGQPRRTGLGI